MHGLCVCVRACECVRLRRDNYGAPRQLSVPDVLGEGEGGGGEDEEEDEEEVRRRAEREPSTRSNAVGSTQSVM